ncbi:CU044_2847 family protein [Streptomyces sp. NPDC091879]|uniref:CU044_2847 family protein n=1 Tax=Streptomyces sp. NPDC091879 TaxID=3366006 RepID=UPI0037FD0388
MGVIRPDREQVVTYTTYDGEEVQVEIKPAADDFRPIDPDRPIGRLERVFRPILHAATAAARAARESADQPDEITVRFGLALTGSGQAVVARGSNESNFEITLHWHRRPSANAEALYDDVRNGI